MSGETQARAQQGRYFSYQVVRAAGATGSPGSAVFAEPAISACRAAWSASYPVTVPVGEASHPSRSDGASRSPAISRAQAQFYGRIWTGDRL